MSDKEQAWLSEYLKCFDATAAARRVGYKWPDRQGYQKKQKFADEIQKHLEEKAMSRDEALARLADIARGDLSHYILSDGEFDIESMKADGVGQLLKKYKKVTKRTIAKDGREFENEYMEVELYPADNALTVILRQYQPDGSEDRPINIKVTLSDD